LSYFPTVLGFYNRSSFILGVGVEPLNTPKSWHQNDSADAVPRANER